MYRRIPPPSLAAGASAGRSLLAVLATLTLSTGLPAAAAAQETPCEGVLSDPQQLASMLSQVPKYQTSYVLVYPDRLAERAGSLATLAASGLRVASYDGSAAAELAALIPDVSTRSLELTGGGGLVEQLLAGDLDATVMWAPLAGLAVLELDLDYQLSMLTVGEPSLPPSSLTALDAWEGAAQDPPPACAEEVLVLLESYGVLPAEKLVPIDITELLALRPPPRATVGTRSGAELYELHCAKCHGPEAVAATDALAPVDLLVSTRRFSYPGFLYIALNGREQKGMPGFRGALSQEQVAQIYQYVRERSHGTISTSEAGR